MQEDEYYAFGLNLARTRVSTENKYLHNGKEKQDVLNDELDYGARFYDPVVGRWTSVDPLAEKMRRHSPHNYGLNTPLRFTDPDGNAPTDIIIKGAGGSSITVKTELIDLEVNASSLGIGFGGNYTLNGDEGGRERIRQVIKPGKGGFR